MQASTDGLVYLVSCETGYKKDKSGKWSKITVVDDTKTMSTIFGDGAIYDRLASCKMGQPLSLTMRISNGRTGNIVTVTDVQLGK